MKKRTSEIVDIVTLDVGHVIDLEKTNLLLARYYAIFNYIENQKWFEEHREEVFEFIQKTCR